MSSTRGRVRTLALALRMWSREPPHPHAQRRLPDPVRGADAEPDVRPVLQGELVQQPRRQPPGHRSGLLAAARRHPGRQEGDRHQQAERRQVRVAAHLPRRQEVRPDHGFHVLLLRPDRDREGPGLRAVRAGQQALHQPPRRPRDQLRAGRRQRRAHHRPQGPGRCIPGPDGARRRRPGGRGGDRPEDRPDPGDGLDPDLQPGQAGDPRLRRREEVLRPARRRRRRAAAQPLHPDRAAAGFDLQAGHRRGRDGEPRQESRQQGLRWRAPGPAAERQGPSQRERRLLRRRPDHTDSRARGLLQHGLRPARHRSDQGAAGRPGPEVRVRPEIPHRPAEPGDEHIHRRSR